MEDKNKDRENRETVENTENVETEETVADTEANAKKEKKEKKEKSIGREIFEWAYSIVIAIIIAFLIKTFLFDLVKVDGLSMYPTLNHNDRLIVTKLGYEPEQGDIIILDAQYSNREAYYASLAKSEGKTELSATRKFKENFSLPDSCKKKYYVKRVIATEGQTVDVRDGFVYIDGKKLNEPYYDGLTEATQPSVKYPFTVSEDCVFVMGDNRYNSTDSRSAILGEVKEDAILGKAQLRILPFNAMGKVK